MAVIGFAILGVVIGAAGMQFLRLSEPELVERAEGGLKRFWNSMPFTKLDEKKAKAK